MAARYWRVGARYYLDDPEFWEAPVAIDERAYDAELGLCHRSLLEGRLGLEHAALAKSMGVATEWPTVRGRGQVGAATAYQRAPASCKRAHQ